MKIYDTIAAIATGNTIAAIGIIRISGEKALTAADNIFRAACGIKLREAATGKMYYGEVLDTQGNPIDICLCTISRAPNSYTGEDTAEFHCHGSPVVLAEVLQRLQQNGVRLAVAGEFTKRAFLNGKMDLTQSEAVIDIIEAETPLGAKNAASQLKGTVYTKITAVYNRLVDIMAHFHALIDYPDEDIEEFLTQNYQKTLTECEEDLRRLFETYKRGKVLKAGIPTAITGRTNTGKSSLLNALLGFERAIVTDIAGTTRDTIEEKVLIGQNLLRLTDTAGLRNTNDTVEKLGIGRTLAAINGAQLILAVLDGSQSLQDDDIKVLQTIPPEVPAIILINKSDLPQKIEEKNINPVNPGTAIIRISAKTGFGLEKLEAEITKIYPEINIAAAGEIITNARQAEAIKRAADSLNNAGAALTDAVSPDAALTDIETALTAVGEITGAVMREDIVSRIFERFCVGK